MDSITFYGAASEVGRSCFVIESNETTMLDCGIKLEGRTPVPPLFDVKHQSNSIDQVVISHAHLDHVGYLPALYQNGFSGKTLLTKPSRDIAEVLFADALKIQGDRFFNKHSIEKTLGHMKFLDYRKPSGGIELRDAGHILGSAMPILDTNDHRVLYTGDVNLRPTRLLDGADTTDLEADTLIIEGTYGGEVRQATKKTINTFINHVSQTLKKNGKVLVPTFAIGRGQEVLLTLESYMKSKALPVCPIFLDGMVKKITKIHRHNANFLKRELQLQILTSDSDPFKSEFYREPTTRSKKEVYETSKSIIVAPSGMLIGGASVGYFQKLAPVEKNTVILVGYQANDTPGRLLKEGVRMLEVGGKMADVCCRVEVAPFSGHSDSPELVRLAKSVKGLKQVFVVHCEREKGIRLAKQIHRATGVKTIVPHLSEKVQL